VRLERSRYDAADAAEEEEPPRTLVCYKEAQSVAKLDPLPDEWTGTFRDARPINPRGAMPENALTGTMFAANAQRHDPLIVDGARFGRHRAWRGTAARAQADEISPYISPASPYISPYLPRRTRRTRAEQYPRRWCSWRACLGTSGMRTSTTVGGPPDCSV